MDNEKVTTVIFGKISAINYEKRSMLVKSNDKMPIDYALKWEEVLDVVCRKQKAGYRVKVTTITNMTEQNPQPIIKEITYDDTFKSGKGAYADPKNDKIILLQSCLRTGASVMGIASFTEPMSFDDMMDILVARAIKDAATLTAEAKKP